MKFLKSFLLLAICAFTVNHVSAQYNSNGILTGFPFYNNTQSGAGGISVGSYNLGFYYPSNLSSSQVVMFPNTYQYKKVEQNSSPTNNGTITDTLFTERHFTTIDSIHGLQTINLYVDQYVTPGATITINANLNPSDSTRKLLVNFGTSPVDTISVTSRSWRTYFFDGVKIQPFNK